MSVKEEFNMSANAGDELKQEQQDNGQMYENQNYNDQDSQNNDNNSQENGGGGAGDQTGDNNSQNNDDQNYANDQNNSQMDDQNSQNNDENNRSGAGGNSMEPEQFRKVFIGGLSYKTDDETLKSYFSKYGELVDFVVMKDGQSGRSRGFGFVTYSCSSMVDELMKNRPHIIDGRQVEPKRATPREDSGKTEVQMTVKKLFIGGLRDNVTDEDLKTYFGNYGNVVEAIMMKDKETNKSRGFGFVTFDDYDPVDKIILEKHHTINGVNVHTQKALPKDFERNQNNNNNNNNYNNRGGNQSGGGYNNGGNFRSYNNNNGNGFGANNFNNGNGNGGGGGFGNFGMPGFHVGNRNNQFQSNGSLSNTYGSYNQAPNNPKMNSDGNRNNNNNNNNKMGGGPMKGGQGRFTNRSNGPYGGKNNNGGGFNNGGNNFNNNFNNNRPGRGRGIGQRGGGGGGQGNMNNDNQNMNN